MDIATLFPEANLPPQNLQPQTSSEASLNKNSNAQNQAKSFASVVSHNVCNIPISQFPTPYLKGDKLDIVIPEEEYKLGVEACKHHLHDRIIWEKDSTPLTVTILRSKLLELWPSIRKWSITSLEKGFFEFSFSSHEDVQRVRFVGAWNNAQGVLKLFPCTKDFVPSTLKQTSAQVWIRIHGLSQEYWCLELLPRR